MRVTMKDSATPLANRDDPEFRAWVARALGANYTLGQMIGEGGFGRVYAAKDVRLDRDVAIKVIRPDLAGARAFSERFRKEAMALAKFRHPGIVPIYDIQENEGLIFFVMPLITGDTLRARLDRHRVIAPQEVRKLLIELCQCLSATHRAGIVHRDIKPDNVMLEANALARALLMDFGIAKSMEEIGETNSGMMIGTPTYMSPEQANGDAVLDHRSDIYSVGVLGYHMLTGRPPFVGSSSQEVTIGHLMRPAEPIRRLNPSVPQALADTIMRCLAKNPDDRFQNASDLSAELQQVNFSAIGPASPAAPANQAMPFFAGVTLAFLAGAWLAPEGLPVRLWLWMAASFGFVAILCSPITRATTIPATGRVVAWMKRVLHIPPKQ